MSSPGRSRGALSAAWSRRGSAKPGYRPLLWRVSTANAAVLTVACLVTIVVFSPGTISSFVAVRELAILVGALAVMLVANLLLMRRALAPVEQLIELMRRVDPLSPGQRLPLADGPPDSEAAELAEAFNEMLERLETEREESARRALAAQEAERLRVAQELHDEIGQSLTAALLQLGRTKNQAPEELREQLSEAQETVRANLDELRRIAQRLRPDALDELGLVSALISLSERLSEQTGLRLERRLDRQLPALTYEQELVIYRVAQEALTNVVRHSGSKQAVLALSICGDQIALTVADSGPRGIESSEAGGRGIRGMRERALLVEGELWVGRPEDGGTLVRLTLPLAQYPV